MAGSRPWTRSSSSGTSRRASSDSYIVDIAPQIGIRETRRIVGEYQLTEDDVLGCADFPDTIGVNGWPVEAHVAGHRRHSAGRAARTRAGSTSFRSG